MVNSEYLKNLNNAQKEAVMHLDGPLLIVAGAGSGKTKVLTSRIANIIKAKKANQKISAKTIEGGKQLFGSITSNHLADELSKLGFTVDRKFIKLNNIKQIGVYDAEVRLHREVKATLTLEVVAA